MSLLSDELRLLILLAVNAIVLASAARLVRRAGVRDRTQVALDAMLLWYLVQYISVGLPGVFGVLSVGSMFAIAIALCAAMWFAPLTHETHTTTDDSWLRISVACVGVVIAFTATLIWIYRDFPIAGNDSLTYHMPAAAQWIHTGKIGLFPTWYFNPANTYSPLAGSMFIAWLVAPIGADALAQFVEAPAILMIYFIVMQLARSLGAPRTTASLLALAVCCARPFISQTIATKDDLFVVAFFGIAIVALTSDRLNDRFAFVRVGISIGLLLATKYTALLSVPILLLAVHAPIRTGSGWKKFTLALLIVLALAGPWFIRNAIATGNPFYPIDVKVGPWTIARGIFTTSRSAALGSFDGVRRALTQTDQGFPAAGAIAVCIAWIGALVIAARDVVRDPLKRTVLLGPIFGVAIFLIASPYAEARFIYPSILLLFGSVAIIAKANARAGIGVTIVLFLCCIGTSFAPAVLRVIAPTFAIMLVPAVACCFGKVPRRATIAAIVILLSVTGYIRWSTFLRDRRDGANEILAQMQTYESLADAWQFVDEKLPDTRAIAYADTCFVYPLTGPRHDRRVVYAPVRAGVQTMSDLGYLDRTVSGEELVPSVIELMNRGASEDVWLKNLRDSGASVLFIQKTATPGPQVSWARAKFPTLFENNAAIVFEVALK